MVKNSSLIFVLIFAFLFRLEVFSLRLIGVIVLIVVGVILMVATETSFSLAGFFLVLSASAFGGLRWSLTQILLKKDRKQGSMGLDSPPVAIFWMTPAMGIILAALSMIVDNWINIFQSHFFDGITMSLLTSMYILIPGIVAFGLVMSEF
jgi:solute carrier family 35 protein C2